MVYLRQRIKEIYSNMDVGAGGTGGTCPPLFSLGQSAPLHVTWLPTLKTLKMQRQTDKYTLLAISEDLSFKMSWVSKSPDPLADLQIGTGPIFTPLNIQNAFRFVRSSTPRKVLNLTSRSPSILPFNLCAPTFVMHPTPMYLSVYWCLISS